MTKFIIYISPLLCLCACAENNEVMTPRAELSSLLNPTSGSDEYAWQGTPMPDDNCVKMHINPVGGYLARVFNDSNYLHLEAARSLGFQPINNDADAWNIGRPVREISSNQYYLVDDLTHSYPYLVPEAADLLMEIATRFAYEQESRGGGNYRLKVTSLLRTPRTVEKLRRRNRNASDASAHQYGTTFDISYSKFIFDGNGVHRTQEDLKNLLAEVLAELRNSGKCYVKYEKKQGCFHITARPV